MANRVKFEKLCEYLLELRLILFGIWKNKTRHFNDQVSTRQTTINQQAVQEYTRPLPSFVLIVRLLLILYCVYHGDLTLVVAFKELVDRFFAGGNSNGDFELDSSRVVLHNPEHWASLFSHICV